ncbi:MAG TPA: M20 family metallopeptidase [Steroidobacteraceae bacterium]|nr:M20 family metallopeptidase [Steroidobacteraceae bacterium]
MNTERLSRYIDTAWDQSIVPTLAEYIRIPNKSVHFDPQWEQHGHMLRAAELMKAWCEKNALPGMKIEIVRLPGLTPLLYIDVPASGNPASRSNDCVLLYGHMDKQPEFDGWAEGLEPWKPVLRDGRLYGRGGADDGYAVFGSLLALRALADQNIPYVRSVILIEGSEESGSPDLPAYIDELADRIGEPSLVVCLDAECGNYDQFWCTTSLRGNLVGTLRVDVLTEGVHSGMASGIVPSSFRIARRLLERVESAETGKLIDALWCKIPEDRLQQARAAAQTLSKSVHGKMPFASGTRPMSDDPYELLLNSTWRPTLSVTGAEGMPSLQNAGNVLRPFTSLKLSFRLPPGVEAQAAAAAVKKAFESDPPYGAKVAFEVESSMGGWNAPSTVPWLEAAIQSASQTFFGRDAMYMGVGGTIPFMGMLSEKFPRTQFLITGVLGPHSNAHGPNEFLDIATGKRVTACVAHVVAEHAKKK